MKDNILIGRNAVIEAFKTERTIDKIMIQKGSKEGSIKKIISQAKSNGYVIQEVNKEKLDSLSEGEKHQGVIAFIASYDYSTLENIMDRAKDKGEDPFIIVLDNIVDPHNLGAIIRTANIVGAHGIVIPKRRAVGLTAVVAKTSAGAIEHTPVAKVSNIGRTIEDLQKKGLWAVCADMDGDMMYDVDLKGPICLVIGSEGEGVSRLVKEKCDFITRIPMKGEINSLNASVAAGVLMYEIIRQRMK
ncbi:23S rRNA (guanosine(2251)-2'-O)-methyltransferase RlmB [Vallitalea okinawensis]|uniref:23S rRNA (guanosine(2251)-2'-O)-methyltransferase RlmB n=1 Tax=Vallitalea okinawensis TaxID=2078660 RepID=UPI000CFC99D7|nr:23S rRNA (guanosine(2251)-2'-O)-methyltransferase RlmB [Vallitalea okinawensis]